ncbi:MAG: STAS domain-containing protein [Verrucomicrobiota bacterium]|nr:STAS domain-containing protein [Verrucomicrobiota bacterium]
MQVRESQDGGVPVLHLAGEIDLQRSPELRAVLQGHVKVQRPALAIDLSGVDYIDSSGLATLVEYVRHAQEYDGRLALSGLNGRVKTVFELVRLSEFLPIYETLDQARAALSKPPAA